MSHHYRAVVEWAAGATPLGRGRHSRAHRWRFEGGAVVAAAASPLHVPMAFTDPAAVDPEEALVAALASCHMLFFLQLAGEAELAIAHYRDDAVGVLGRRADGREAIVGVTLRPALEWAGTPAPAEHVAAIHARAHARCYLAASVNFPIMVEPQDGAEAATNEVADH